MLKHAKTKKYLIIVGIVIICIGSFFIVKNKKSTQPTANINQESLTTVVNKKTNKKTITGTGTVEFKDEFKVYGENEKLRIKEFFVEVGDYVEVGQKLVSYDIKTTKEEYQNQLKEQTLNLENAKLSLESIIQPASEKDILTFENNIIQAEKSLIEAQNNLNNYEINLAQKNQTVIDAQNEVDKANDALKEGESLFEIGAITENALNDLKISLSKAETTYSTAVTNKTDFENTKNSLELAVKAAENTLANAKLNLEIAKDPLKDETTNNKYKQQLNNINTINNNIAKLKKKLNELVEFTLSTVNGTVTEIPVQVGSYTAENTILLKTAELNDLLVKAYISEYDAPLIKVGQKVEMTSEGIKDAVYTGVITSIEPKATSTSTNLGSETVVPIKISVDNPDEFLKPGYTLDLEIILSEKNDVILVSSNAILNDTSTNKNYVYTIDKNIIKKTEVQIGETSKGKTEILSGIESGTEIISRIGDNIYEGMTIEELKKQGISINPVNKDLPLDKENSDEIMAPMDANFMPY